MNHEQLKERLRAMGCEPDDTTAGYTSRLIRCGCGRHSHVAIAGEHGPARVTKDFGAAVSWCMSQRSGTPLTFVIGRDEAGRWANAAEAIGMLRLKSIEVSLEADFEPCTITPCGDLVPPGWLEPLSNLGGHHLPRPALEVEERAKGQGFRWQRTVTGREWSGRLRGLEVCKLRDSDTVFRVTVGKPGKLNAKTGKRNVSKVHARFAELMTAHARQFGDLVNGTLRLDPDEWDRALAVVLLLAERDLPSLASPEHVFEAKVNQQRHPLLIIGHRLDLVFSERPFQFPAKWWSSDEARYVDVLARRGRTPQVVELKVDLGQGEYYRDGIVQAALYREYVKRAIRLRKWFEDHELDHTACEAVLVVPPLRGRDKRALYSDHLNVAGQFAVKFEATGPTRTDLAANVW